MNEFIQSTVTGVSAFVATNIDDILILMLFFSQVSVTFCPRHIVAGQYLGFLGLILASLPGCLGGFLISKSWLGWLGLIPIGIGLIQLFRSAEETAIQTVSHPWPEAAIAQKRRSPLARLFNPHIFQVAGVTLANGGDNIGIYVPLFANSSLTHLGIILGTFFTLIGIWCGLARHLTGYPLVAQMLTRYGKRIVPFVLIGLGIFIFIDSGTYRLIAHHVT